MKEPFYKKWLHTLKAISLRDYIFGLLIVLTLVGDVIYLPKFLTFGLGVSLLRLFLIPILIYYVYYFIKKDRSLLMRKPALLLLSMIFFWLIYAIVQLFFIRDAMNSHEALHEVYYIALNAGIFICLAIDIGSVERLKKALGIIRFVAMLLILLGMFEITFGLHFNTSRNLMPEFSQYDKYIATGIQYNENDFAFVLTLFAPLFLFWPADASKKRKITDLIFAFLSLVIICVNRSTICMITYLAMLVVVLIFKKAKALLGIGIFVAITAFTQLLMGTIRNAFVYIGYYIKWAILYIIGRSDLIGQTKLNNIGNIISEIGNQVSAGANRHGSLYTRLRLSKEGLRMALESKFLGVGANGFFRNVRNDDEFTIRSPHNWYVEILSQYGILVFLAYFGLLFYSLYRLLREALYRHEHVFMVLFSSMFAFLISCTAPSGLVKIETQWLFYALTILAVAFTVKPVKKAVKERAEAELKTAEAVTKAAATEV